MRVCEVGRIYCLGGMWGLLVGVEEWGNVGDSLIGAYTKGRLARSLVSLHMFANRGSAKPQVQSICPQDPAWLSTVAK